MPAIEEQTKLCVDRILFATDFSPSSEVAESYVEALARHFDAKVEAAHVYDSWRNEYYEGGQLAPLDSKRLSIRGDKLCQLKLQLKHSGVSASCILLEGHPASEKLLTLIEQGGLDLVVLGTHSKSDLKRFVMGSTAETIMRTATRPVLTIGPRVKPLAPRNPLFRSIVYATDFSLHSSRAVAFAKDLTQDSGAHLYLCHVLQKSEGGAERQAAVDHSFLTKLERFELQNSRDWCTTESVLEHGAAAQGILDLAAKIHADLIVLGPHKSSFMLIHVEHGITLDVIANAECPVLTVN
jgi:nucleotide-binding universal stress UspA family protein